MKALKTTAAATLFALAAFSFAQMTPEPCDADYDGNIDKIDLSIISRSRGQTVMLGDPRDSNGDGRITPADVQVCIPQCTLPHCAVL